MRLFSKLFKHWHRWVYSKKTSEDRDTIYDLRTCRKCGKVEIQNIYGFWNDVTTVRFSSVPQFEKWHRDRFEMAK
jgi:hypothetical protein